MALEDELLVATHPFDDSATVVGCPRCKEAEKVRLVCDEPGCFELQTCGWPTGNGGYRMTCSKHWGMK